MTEPEIKNEEVVEAATTWTLLPEDHAVFFGALDRPREPTEALVEAAKRYRDIVISQ